MNTSFGRLASLELRHAYYANPVVRAAEFLVPRDAEALMRAGRMQSRVREGVLHLLIERSGTAPRVALPDGSTIWIGIRPSDVGWSHVTSAAVAPGMSALYSNLATADALDAVRPVRLAAGMHALPLASATRPLTLRLHDAQGAVLASQVITGDEAEASLDLRALPWGLYETQQDDGATVHRTTLLVHDALHAWGAPLVAGLRMSAALYGAASPPAWHIDFAAATQAIEYYVVARNYAANEFAQLRVRDEGAGEEGRPAIDFDRIELADLDPAQHLTPELMGAPAGARIALFRSRSPVARRERARRHLQLARNNDVLIAHLPQPDTNRAKPQFVIHLSKP